MAPPTNDFLPFATAPGANVASQAGYLADPIVPAGFATGLLVSAKTNKVWRQSSFVAASVAQLIFETLAVDVLDNGDLGTFVDLLEETIARLGAGGIGEAPSDGKLYGRRNTNWALAAPEAPMDGRVYGRQSGGWMPSVAEAPLDRRVYARSGTEHAWYAAPTEAPADGLLYGRNGQLISWQPVPGEAPPDGLIYGRRGSDRSWQLVSGGDASVTIAPTPPPAPKSGDLWWSSADGIGQLFIYYVESGAGGSSQWVVANAGVSSSGGGNALTIASKTADYTIPPLEKGLRYNNNAAPGTVIGTLPAAAAGLFYGFVVLVPQYHTARATGSDTILFGGRQSAPGGYIRSNLPGSALLLECHVAGKWLAASAVGTWGLDL